MAVIEMKIPSPGESITEVQIDNWVVEDGAYVERDDLLAEIQSDKAMLELYAEESGVISIKAPAGETVEVGGVACTIDTSAEKPASAEQQVAPAQQESQQTARQEAAVGQQESQQSPQQQAPAEQGGQSAPQGGYAQGVPSPSADRVLHEKNLSAEQVNGTGRGGRITKADAVAAQAQPAQPAAASQPAQPAAPQLSGERSEQRQKMTQLRKTVAQRLVAAKNQTAMLTTFNEVDLTEVMKIRKQYKEQFKETHEVSLGFMGFFTKAVTNALAEFPWVNSQINEGEIVTPNYVDMGIAVSTERGLMVPIIRDADKLSLDTIEREVIRMADKARKGKISLPEMQGGTFTITNGGVFGSLLSTPILNPPQSAILGMHKIQPRPMVINGEIQIRNMMYLALSYDHRIVDGKESVTFLVRVKDYLEDPIRLMLNV